MKVSGNSPIVLGTVALLLSQAGYAAAQVYHPMAYQQHQQAAPVDYIDPGSFDEARLCQMIHHLTNVERTRRGLQPLGNHRGAAAAASHHSRDMARRGYFDHKSKGLLRRTNPSQRMASYGFQPRMSAENIAMVPTFNSQVVQTTSGRASQTFASDHNGYGRLAQYAMQEWMRSPGHRKNILNPQLTTMGVGAAVGMRGNVPYVYLTQNFGG